MNLEQSLLLLRVVEKKILEQKARDCFKSFVEATFDGQWIDGWHQDIICGYLEKLERGEIRRLIITMPPRHGKSELGSRKFPAWCIGRNPKRSIILAAYAATLTYGFSRNVQAAIDNPSFMRIFPRVTLSDKHRGVEGWSVNDNSMDTFIAAGVGGPVTGRGGGILILDDPIKNKEEAESEVYRDKVWEWWKTTFRTRLEPGGSILIMLTRWHEDDLVARLLTAAKADKNADQWVVLNLPAIANENLSIDDPRPVGEALFPARWPLNELINLKSSITEREFEALYQGNPRPPEGARFKRSWFEKIIPRDELPKERVRVRYWDWAVTPENGDYTVGTLISKDLNEQRYVEDMIRGQWEWSEAQEVIIQTAKLDGKDVIIGIEQVAKDVAFLKALKRKLLSMGYVIIGVPTRSAKIPRSNLWETMAREGMITLVNGEWIPVFLYETCSFPFGQYDDIVDSVSGGMEMLEKRSIKTSGEIPIKPEKHIDAHRAGHDAQIKEEKKLKTDIRGLVRG
jgi:predicted phage terminase large subunit-like protein